MIQEPNIQYRKPFKSDAAAFGAGGAELTDEIDFDAMDERLAGKSADAAVEHVAQTGDSEHIVNLMDWLEGPRAEAYFGRAFMLRLVALAWVSNPASFQGDSLSEIAQKKGVTVQALSKYAAEASRIFKLRNRSQETHGKRWEKN